MTALRPRPSVPAVRRGEVLRYAGVLVGAVFVQAALLAVSAVWSPDPRLGYGFTWAVVVGLVLAAGASAPVLRPWPAAASLGLAACALVAVLAAGAGVRSLAPAATVAVGLLVLGGVGGAFLGGRVEKVGYLSVVAYVSSLADVFSVLSPSGVSAHVLESERLLSVVALSMPMPGGDGFVPVLGVGDLVMSAFYLAASRAVGLSVRRTGLGLLLSYGVILGALLWLERSLPALPFLGLGVVLAQPSTLRIAPEDRRTALGGCAMLTLLFAALWVGR